MSFPGSTQALFDPTKKYLTAAYSCSHRVQYHSRLTRIEDEELKLVCMCVPDARAPEVGVGNLIT